MVPGVKIVVTKESRAEGPAEEEATVVAGKWEEVEGVARGEAAVGAHLHNFLESATHFIFSLSAQHGQVAVVNLVQIINKAGGKIVQISWQASPSPFQGFDRHQSTAASQLSP